MHAPKDRRTRVAVTGVAAVLLALGLSVAAAVSASAGQRHGIPLHAQWQATAPAPGARLTTAPTEVAVSFNEPVEGTFAQIGLSRDGTEVSLARPQVTGPTVRAAITGTLVDGSYRIVWRVVGADGHPLSGESGFSLVGVGAAAAAAPSVRAAPTPTEPPPTYKTRQGQPTSIGHPDHTPGLIIATVLVLCGVALLVVEHRRGRHR